MKILFVTGEYLAAAEFEKNFFPTVVAKNLKVNETKQVDEGIYATLYEFGEVDLSFIEFIKSDIQDYDMSKHQNFYVIKE